MHFGNGKLIQQRVPLRVVVRNAGHISKCQAVVGFCSKFCSIIHRGGAAGGGPANTVVVSGQVFNIGGRSSVGQTFFHTAPVLSGQILRIESNGIIEQIADLCTGCGICVQRQECRHIISANQMSIAVCRIVFGSQNVLYRIVGIAGSGNIVVTLVHDIGACSVTIVGLHRVLCIKGNSDGLAGTGFQRFSFGKAGQID